MTTKRHRGIAGLEGRTNVGCVLSIGIKGDRGNPVEKDRFHILGAEADAQNRRHHHPRFGAFNKAHVTHRRSVMGRLVHATEEECFRYSLGAYRPKGRPSPESKRFFCSGDGVRATRFTGMADGVEQFASIACPNEACEFRKGKRAECKPQATLLFQLEWSNGGLPTLLTKLKTQSWNSIDGMVGMFRNIRAAATQLGMPDYSLAGFPILVELTERTSKQHRSRFPVLSVSPRIDPLQFFTGAIELRERMKDVGMLGAQQPTVVDSVPALPSNPAALTDLDGEGSDDVIAADVLALEPGVSA